MKIAQFERFYGKIRKLGRAQIEREQPHILGQSIAETLYYTGASSAKASTRWMTI